MEVGLDNYIDADLESDVGFFKEITLTSSDKEWRGNATEALINRLCPELIEGVILDRSLLIDGHRQFGKTTTACRLAFDFVNLIQERGCTYNLIPVRSFAQVKHMLNEANYQVILIDDARRYNKKMNDESINDLQEIRHIFEELQETGCVIVIWIIQDSYRLDREVREQLSGIMYKALKLTNWSINDLVQLMGHKLAPRARRLLSGWLEGVMDDNNLKLLSRAIIITHTWCGYINLPPAPIPEFIPFKPITNEKGIKFLEPTEEDIKQMTQWKHCSEDVTFTLINEFDGLELIVRGLQNWENIVNERNITLKRLRQKHIEAFLLNVQGSTKTSIAEEYNITRQALDLKTERGGWLTTVRAEFIGHMLEHQLIQPHAYYETFDIIAGNGRVDLMSNDKKKAIEVKARQQYETPRKEMLSKEMLHLLEEENVRCELCLCIIRKGTVLFKIYEISKNDKNAKYFDESLDDPYSPDERTSDRGINDD